MISCAVTGALHWNVELKSLKNIKAQNVKNKILTEINIMQFIYVASSPGQEKEFAGAQEVSTCSPAGQYLSTFTLFTGV